MEEAIGKLWHRLITRVADTGHTEAAVELDQVARTVGVLFRAMGGDGGLQVAAATARQHGARRSWLQRIAGSHETVELAWRDGETLYLPARIALFPDPGLNRDLFLWLAAMAAVDTAEAAPWFQRNQRLTCRVLERYPGMRGIYTGLVEGLMPLRPDPSSLPEDEARQEQAVRQALLDPGSASQLPVARREPQPVYLWLHPDPPARASGRPAGEDVPDRGEGGDHSQEVEDPRRRQGERVDMPDGRSGLITFRMETLFTWAEHVSVDRTTDEDEDLDSSERALGDLDRISVARDKQRTASKLRFDLDLPPEENDDRPLGGGVLLPEWDYKKQQMQPDHCRLQPMIARNAEPIELPPHLRRSARLLRNQFEALAPVRTWQRSQPDGSDVDLDAYLEFHAERIAGHTAHGDGLYRELKAGARDLACLLLADLSLSTDTYVNNNSRVIDVIRESLFLFSEALSATRDRFALYGFSSRRREHVRFNLLKNFNESYNASVRGRIQAIRPGYYTRMGAAIRQASLLLARQPAHRHLLLIITDGKPNDLDRYEGRYGAEDTRMAIIEARRLGLQPFCVTIDRKANDYLPHLFGSGGYLVIRRPEQLPRELPKLYVRLTNA